MSAARDFVHLHCHSSFSLRDGAVRPEGLAEAAAERGMRAVALTDHESLSGAVRFVQACERLDVTPVVGAEVAVDAGDRAVLLAPGRRGWSALCGLLTETHMRSADTRAIDIEASEERDPGWPRVPWDVLERYADFLVCLSGGPKGAVGKACARRGAGGNEAEAAARRYLELFGTERFRIELQRHLLPGENAWIGRALEVARTLGVRTVATNDVHYAAGEDAFLHDVLRCVRRLVPLDLHAAPLDAERWLKPALEMRTLFTEAPEAVWESGRMVRELSLAADIGLGERCLPHFPGLRGESAADRLRRDARAGLGRRGLRSREARDRLEAELGTIVTLGFDSYFLVVADIVREIRARGIRVSCRGSAVGALTCYALGISDVDPIEHGLLFERFLSEWRDELPDVDLDVESHRREEILDYLLRTYGAGHMGMACMFETFRAREAIRDAGKALGFPPEDIDQIAKAFPHVSARDIPRAREELPEVRAAGLQGPDVERLLAVAERLDGFPRHIAVHPSGVLLASVDLDTRTPLQPSFLRFPMSQHDKDDVEVLGLLKLDVIGVRMLSSMRHAVREVARVRGERIDLDTVSRDDADTYELIQTSRTLGCFQIESPGQRELVTKLLPERFSDLIVDISLFRPGPVKADMVTPYLRRRMRLDPAEYIHPAMREILRETHGVIVFHEQIIRIAAAFTGMSFGEADAFRRSLDNAADLPRLRAYFVDTGLRRGFGPRALLERIWTHLEAFASFGFCKAHAAAFAVPTYQSAWLKTHYPAEFFSGVLTHDPGMYPKRAILADARRFGIPILPVDVAVSDGEYRAERVEGGGGGAPLRHVAPASPGLLPHPCPPRRTTPAPEPIGIRLSLADVKGISSEEIERIVEERPFESLEDLVRRTRMRRPVAEALCECGALDRFGPRRVLLLETARIYGGGLLAGVRGAQQEMRDLGLRRKAVPRNRQASLFEESGPRLAQLRGWGVGEGLGAWLARDYTPAERMRAELDVLGMDASGHVLELYEPLLERMGWTPAARLPRLRAGATVLVAGVKVASQTPPVRSGRRIIFLTLDDPTGPSDVVVFEDAQERCARTVFDGWVLAVKGKLRRTGRIGASVVAEQVWDLTQLQPDDAPAQPAGHGRGRGRFYHASGGSAG